MLIVRLELAPLGYKPTALAIELTNSKAIAGKELSLSSWYIASLYIYHCSTMVTSHPRSTVVLLDTGTPGTSREIFLLLAEGLRVRVSQSASSLKISLLVTGVPVSSRTIVLH